MSVVNEDGLRCIDQALDAWRQGDCVVGEQWFAHRLDVRSPLTPEAHEAAAVDVDLAESLVRGLMVATQTCDIVRPCSDRPFVEVCPLVEMDLALIREVRLGQRPRYAHVPGVERLGLVADLDRVMTVEKAVVAGWERTPGCSADRDARRLSLALARKRARVAFPDDFVALVSGLLRRLSSKHDKGSEEGRSSRALREIRVTAHPSWSAASVELLFWFIREEGHADFGGRSWEHHLDAWLRLVPKAGRFERIEGLVQTLEDLTARDYVESDPLDLEHLSTRER